MSRLWIFDIDSDFAAGNGLLCLRARERNRYEIASASSELEGEIGEYRTSTESPPRSAHTPTSSNIYQLQSTKFTLHLLRHARTFSCIATRARLQQRHNHFVNVYSVVLIFFYIEQETMAQLLRGEVCLILRTGFYHTFVTRVFQYFTERLNISLLCAWWYKYTLLLIILFAMLQNIAN